MTLVASGQISIGTDGTDRSINVEAGRSATATSELNEDLMRRIARKASGTIAFSDFYGMIGPFTQSWTTPQASTSWTAPGSGTYYIHIDMCGGGGGGANAAAFPVGSNPGYGGGGGAAALIGASVQVTGGSTYTVNVGDGGAPMTDGGYSAFRQTGTNAIIAFAGGGAHSPGTPPNAGGSGGSNVQFAGSGGSGGTNGINSTGGNGGAGSGTESVYGGTLYYGGGGGGDVWVDNSTTIYAGNGGLGPTGGGYSGGTGGSAYGQLLSLSRQAMAGGGGGASYYGPGGNGGSSYYNGLSSTSTAGSAPASGYGGGGGGGSACNRSPSPLYSLGASGAPGFMTITGPFNS